MMKILFVSPCYYPAIGGVETQARLIAQEWAKKHQVSMAAANFGFRHPQYVPGWLGKKMMIESLYNNLLAPTYSSFKDGDIPVHAVTPSLIDRLRLLPILLRNLPLLRRYTDPFLDWFSYQCYRSVFQRKLEKLMQSVDVVHCLLADYLGFTALDAAKKQGIPCVCTPYVHPGQSGENSVIIQTYPRFEAVGALTEGDRQKLISMGVPAEKLHILGVIPLLPATTNPDKFRQQHNLVDVPVIVFVGRRSAYKGTKALLSAAHQVWQTIPNAHFVFVSPKTSESSEWFENADPRIHYLGKVSDQEKADAIAACNIFCMPSLFEILPAVYLEAWSYGKPVIGGKAQSVPELIEGNNPGFAVEQTPEEIAAAITKLLEDPIVSQNLGDNGKALVTQNYPLSAVVSKSQSLYQKVIKSQKS
jgi:glycosyltransferase involved in cell wall biosynthesis